MRALPLVLASPHSGSYYPPEFVASRSEPAAVRLDGTSSWGQLLDHRECVKPGVREAFLRNLPRLDPVTADAGTIAAEPWDRRIGVRLVALARGDDAPVQSTEHERTEAARVEAVRVR